MSNSKARAESALDAVFEILEEVRELKAYIKVVDTDLKLANNKIAKLQKLIQASSIQASVPQTSNPNVVADPTKIIEKSGFQGQWAGGKIKTFGRVVSRNKKPIPDVLVKVYNEDGHVIATRETDHKGYWETRLPVGKFGIEYIHKGFKNINLTIELDNSMKNFEVK